MPNFISLLLWLLWGVLAVIVAFVWLFAVALLGHGTTRAGEIYTVMRERGIRKRHPKLIYFNSIEKTVLLYLHGLEGAESRAIQNALESCGHNTGIINFYVSLHDLELKGYIMSARTGDNPESRLIYALTGEGEKHVARWV